MDLLLPLLILALLLALVASRLFGRDRQPARPDAPDQLRIVMRARFERKRLLSRTEFELFRTVEQVLPRCGPGYRLMAQPSLGEVLATEDDGAFRCINAKRVDMLVIDAFSMPVLAIEHQGKGHYQGDAPARDAVKREALRRAGVEYLEIFDTFGAEEVRGMVSAALQRATPPRPLHQPRF
ncbi:DUF2726 domain-containing protein [Devosia chinhatensis]|uniref:DUF2726 domain-containing protein n=1 Tax=Devosia chinhatensis TaxID=429727 RepID=UPI000697F3D0|nr:DUF2726 domain-containing protein [Devosia chinhatensis]